MTKAGVDSPRLCAHVLVRQVLGLDRIACVTQADRQLSTSELEALELKNQIITQEGELNSVAQTIARAESGRLVPAKANMVPSDRRPDGLAVLAWVKFRNPPRTPSTHLSEA